MSSEVDSLLSQIQGAVAAEKVTASAAENIKIWLTQSRYATYASQVAELIKKEEWQALDDAFWTVIPFGTGGRRGRMYPIGSNAINERTIGESAQGLASYVKETVEGPLSCGIAYDTRHRSREFAELCARIMVANGIKVYFLDDYRSTPELSFLVRYKKCSCGIMVTASHNPPSDNAVKVYWSTGGQVLPPHDKAIIDRVMNVEELPLEVNFDDAVASGNVEICTAEVDAAFIENVKGQRFAGPRDLKLIYSPLHGVGASAVIPALKADGFTDVEIYGPHAEPNGDFPNVPGHVSNPENPQVFDAIIERAKEAGAEFVLATDPDCDRVGCAAPVTSDLQGEWRTFNGNQIGALLCDYVLSKKKAGGGVAADNYVIKTLVTTEMVRRIADSYGVKTYGNLQVGFKYIGGTMDEVGPDNFLFGCEESHGYLVGQYARDKDAAVASMLLCELAADCKANGQTLHEKMESLWWQHGYHAEHLLNQKMEGSEGMANMKKLMAKFREQPPNSLGGLKLLRVRDYKNDVIVSAAGEKSPLNGPPGDMVILDLEEGNYVAVRPSGTEPKVKFYMFTYVEPEQLSLLEMAMSAMEERIAAFERELKAFTAAI
ncbi:phospho-sugar mutase [Blastopirellula sp. JC732]|uniref:Phospho-sugar mutase n=1 Tax=Blastopirellula sediminis TaxID=2894196 RepID=A0A9X1MJS3_9BACT|nr:phospho-sugar mutase [Blastopirellula sediminis]MCC9609634.1 phospho-sugar mutase [Blastopirellula sediminis]MCC9627590.1 phospho-sugar mutase [Blastopirellula sediminis]